MEQQRIERMSELTKLARQRELTPEECAEREKLRREYIADCKSNLESQLKNIRIVNEKGEMKPLQKRKSDR